MIQNVQMHRRASIQCILRNVKRIFNDKALKTAWFPAWRKKRPLIQINAYKRAEAGE